MIPPMDEIFIVFVVAIPANAPGAWPDFPPTGERRLYPEFCGGYGGSKKGDSDRNRNPLVIRGGPSGVRTRVFAVRGRRPGPLDDGTGWLGSQGSNLETVGQSHV